MVTIRLIADNTEKELSFQFYDRVEEKAFLAHFDALLDKFSDCIINEEPNPLQRLEQAIKRVFADRD